MTGGEGSAGPFGTAALAVRTTRVPGGRRRLGAVLDQIAGLAAERAGRPVELSFVLVDDAEMADLHLRFSGVEGATDVLAFELMDEPLLMGEVVVSADTARREAARRGHPAYDETVLYAVHGVLHLLGHDDHDPVARRRMRRAERRMLAALGLPPVFGKRRSSS